MRLPFVPEWLPEWVVLLNTALVEVALFAVIAWRLRARRSRKVLLVVPLLAFLGAEGYCYDRFLSRGVSEAGVGEIGAPPVSLAGYAGTSTYLGVHVARFIVLSKQPGSSIHVVENSAREVTWCDHVLSGMGVIYIFDAAGNVTTSRAPAFEELWRIAQELSGEKRWTGKDVVKALASVDRSKLDEPLRRFIDDLKAE